MELASRLSPGPCSVYRRLQIGSENSSFRSAKGRVAYQRHCANYYTITLHKLLLLLHQWHWQVRTTTRVAPLIWRQRSCDVQAGGHSPLMPERSGTSVPRRSLCPLSNQRHLRTADQNLLQVPRHRLNTYNHRAFAVAGPSAWNSLPDPVCNPNATEAAFWCLLRTFLFARY